MKTNKVALFGGSFNPVHVGHLYIADAIRKRCKLDKIIFIPSRRSPFKESSDYLWNPVERLNLLKRVIATDPFFKVSDYEVKSKGPSYTINTLRYFAKKYNKLFLIVGGDAFLALHKWRDWEGIAKLATIITYPRQASYKQLQSYAAKHKIPAVILKLKAPEISSTMIREIITGVSSPTIQA